MTQKHTASQIGPIAVIGNYLPRKCGIATFTTDLCNAIAPKLSDRVHVLAMDDIPQGYEYPQRVKFQLRAAVPADYQRAAEFIQFNRYELVILQHEFGIYGGPAGAYILRLLKGLRVPVLTTLHTVLLEPTDEQRRVMIELARYSERLVVMSHRAQDMLHDVYGIDPARTAFIPHGIPDLPFSDSRFYKDKFGFGDKRVILTFGLLGPGKGIEQMIQAMPDVVREHPDAMYLVLGETHPHIKRATGDEYRNSLQQLANKLGVDRHVVFQNRFVTADELCHYLEAADVYVTPYLTEAQITSGTLAYAMGAGTPVVSTPFWYAQEMLADNRGVLVPFKDPPALADKINSLLSDEQLRHQVRSNAYESTRPMVWAQVGDSYIDLAATETHRLLDAPKPKRVPESTTHTLDELPELNLTHLRTLTDDTGILQHADYATPNRQHGYCTDDNARGLIVACMHHEHMHDDTAVPLMQVYLSFLQHALNRDSGRFRNFMSYDRRWMEDQGSEDAHGRSVWALGVAVRYARLDAVRDLATHLFTTALPAAERLEAPRAQAFSLIGLHEYMSVFGGDSEARRLRNTLARRLHGRFTDYQQDGWPWFEDTVTYANAKPPHALLLAGQWMPDAGMYKTGIESLRWLLEQQTTPAGYLSIIGNEKWMRRGGNRSRYDQQPIDAMALLEACAEAYRSTREQYWLDSAWRCLEWFLGRNDGNTPLYDFKTGGCRDGLQPDGANCNQGAESTLAWLVALLTMYQLLAKETLEETPTRTQPDPAPPAAAPIVPKRTEAVIKQRAARKRELTAAGKPATAKGP